MNLQCFIVFFSQRSDGLLNHRQNIHSGYGLSMVRPYPKHDFRWNIHIVDDEKFNNHVKTSVYEQCCIHAHTALQYHVVGLHRGD